jgi:hypothetical protein
MYIQTFRNGRGGAKSHANFHVGLLKANIAALSSAEAIGIGLHEWNRLTYESYMKFQLGRETRAGTPRAPPSPRETSCKRA